MRVAVLTVAILIISQVAYAEPVHLICDGQTLTTNGKVHEENTRSLTIDLAAGTVTFDGSETLGILPTTPMDPHQDRVEFIAVPQPAIGVSIGSFNRITGVVSVEFTDKAFYSGVCKPARKLF